MAETEYGSVRQDIYDKYAALCQKGETFALRDRKLKMDLKEAQMKLDAVPWWDPYSAAYYKAQKQAIQQSIDRNSESRVHTYVQTTELEPLIDQYELADRVAGMRDVALEEELGRSGRTDIFSGEQIADRSSQLYRQLWDQEMANRGPLSQPAEFTRQEFGALQPAGVATPQWLQSIINTSREAAAQQVARTAGTKRDQAPIGGVRGAENPLRGLSSQNRDIDESKTLQMMSYLGFQKAGGTYTQQTIDTATQMRESWFQDYWKRMMAMMPSASRLPTSRTMARG